MRSLFEFEEQLARSLNAALGGRLPKTLAAAVSGGADSVSLLCALAALKESADEKAAATAGQKNGERRGVKKDGAADGQREGRGLKAAAFPKIVCVTVDHSIRPEEESAGDAALVLDLCLRLGVECSVRKIPRGEVLEAAKKRKMGLEEAARFLRYQEFERFAEESGAEAVCLAHNQNDALETILMRFLQGSSSAGGGGIESRRGIYVRPLLQTSRAQIEEYLRQKKVAWRTDATNGDNGYLRNKIRNILVPLLDEHFEGWKTALLSGAEKAARESEALEAALDAALENGASARNAALARPEGGQEMSANSRSANGLETAAQRKSAVGRQAPDSPRKPDGGLAAFFWENGGQQADAAEKRNDCRAQSEGGQETSDAPRSANGQETEGRQKSAVGQRADGFFAFPADFFSGLPAALRRRLVFRAADFLGAGSRVPYSFAKKISLWPEKAFQSERAAGFLAEAKKDELFLKIQEKQATESGFFDIIERGGGGELFVERSPAAGDKIAKNAGGRGAFFRRPEDWFWI